ncbi:MAG: LysE family translocator [Pseudomonadota bacterium]
MDLQSILAFAIVAALLVISPGPNGLLIAKTVATRSAGAGFANIAGFVAAFCLQSALSVLGVAALLVQSAQLFMAFKLLGACYLIYLGIKSLREAFAAPTNSKASLPQATNHKRGAFLEGFLTNALNPKTAMFYLAAFPQFVPQGQGAWLAAATLVAVHCVLNALWFGGMIAVLQKAGKRVVRPLTARVMKGATGAIFVAFGVKLATIRTV